MEDQGIGYRGDPFGKLDVVFVIVTGIIIFAATAAIIRGLLISIL